jgi:SAM-dependent MidA family methyltransferase
MAAARLVDDARRRHPFGEMSHPDATIPAEGELARRIRASIERDGPITFAAFMEAALYDEDDGFYRRPPVGETEHFVTSPHVSPVFGMLVARQLEEMWDLLDRPEPFDVIEGGAGDGTLAGQVLEALPPDVRGVTRYVAVERAALGRAAMAGAGIHAVAGMEEVASGLIGCVFANELLDNVPFHRVRRTAHGLSERLVTTRGDGFGLIDGPLSAPDLAPLVPDIPEGAEWLVSPQQLRFVDEARRVLRRGYLWVVDYGLGSPGQAPSVHGYRSQGLEPDVLAAPGSRDITAGVDFEALRRHALAAGLSVWGPVSQREALLALGFRDVDRRAQARQQEAIAARRGIDAMRIYSNRTRANMLVANGGLGDFKVICMGRDIDVPPRSVRASVW